MRLYLNTRGKSLDYRFLANHAPTSTWWSQFDDYTDLEDFTLLLESLPEAGGGWRLYMSQIPSQRRDKRETPIWYTLVLEQPSGSNTPQDTSDVKALIQQSLDKKGRQTLGQRLDDLFPEGDVEQLLKQNKEEGLFKVEEQLKQLKHLLAAPGDDQPPLSEDQQCLLSAATRILEGEPGFASYFNDDESNQETLQPLVSRRPVATILTPKIFHEFTSALLEKKTLPLTPPQKTADRRVAIVLIATGVVIASLTAGWMAYKIKAQPKSATPKATDTSKPALKQ